MVINIMIYKIGKETDVRTIVGIDDKIYSEGTGLSTTSAIKGRAMELETLESVIRHLGRIQQNLLNDVERGII